MDRFGCFFFIAHFVTNKQYHTTAQNTSKQLAQCNFHHVCSCMGSVLFSNMLKETHAVDYVGQSFSEVGWYGKTCLFSLWILVVKGAVRIWIGLDGFFPHSLRNQHQQHLRNTAWSMIFAARWTWYRFFWHQWPYSKCISPYSKTKVFGLAPNTLYPEKRLSWAKQILMFYILTECPWLYITSTFTFSLTLH